MAQKGSQEEGAADGLWPWRSVSRAEYLGAALAVAGTLYSESAYGNPGSGGWTARNGFDEGVRDRLRLRSRDARDAVNTAGDALMWGLITAPVLDTVATLGLRDQRWGAQWQTQMMNLESFAVTALFASVIENSVRREKPYVRNCLNGRCEDNDDRYRSMPSGHVAFAFTGAGLICTHHAYQNLYADPATERAACAASLGLAATTGVLRIMADRHYATDVTVGSLIGLFSGFLLPRLVHYWPADARPKPGPDAGSGARAVGRLTLSPQVLEGGAVVACRIAF